MSTWHFASRAHPSCLSASACGSPPRVVIEADAWLAPAARLLTFDRLVHESEDRLEGLFTLAVEGSEPGLTEAARQVALRYQRLFTVRNRHSDHAGFDRLLAHHASLHDRGKPLVRADHDHALDVWQWVLRLDPEASEALQIAALFHDIERLASEADQRIEQHAASYLAFKQRHAARGAAFVRIQLAQLGIDDARAARAAELVARHEQPGDDEELAVLNDADALSFFALNSAGFLAYFGLPHTQKKVAYTLGRMRPAARRMLDEVRLEAEVAALIAPQPT